MRLLREGEIKARGRLKATLGLPGVVLGVQDLETKRTRPRLPDAGSKKVVGFDRLARRLGCPCRWPDSLRQRRRHTGASRHERGRRDGERRCSIRKRLRRSNATSSSSTSLIAGFPNPAKRSWRCCSAGAFAPRAKGRPRTRLFRSRRGRDGAEADLTLEANTARRRTGRLASF